ncbi:hypothetical protein JOQ06_027446, partial [Pogonophryne albipinna]
MGWGLGPLHRQGARRRVLPVGEEECVSNHHVNCLPVTLPYDPAVGLLITSVCDSHTAKVVRTRWLESGGRRGEGDSLLMSAGVRHGKRTLHGSLGLFAASELWEREEQQEGDMTAEGSSFLQMGASLEQQIVCMFKLMEEYDWGEFAVITSLLPGYDTFVDIVQSYTDTSYFLWNLQDVLSLEMSVGSNDARTKRMLQQVDSQVLMAYCSYEEAQYLFQQAAEVGLLGPGYIWIIPSQAVSNPDSPPPASFPIGVIGVITDQWRKSLRQRVREGVAIVAQGAESFKKLYGFIPEGQGDCTKLAKHSDNNTLFRHMLNVTWERKDLSFNSQGFLTNPSMVLVALDRDRLWDKVGTFSRGILQVRYPVWPRYGSFLEQVSDDRHLTVATLEEHPFVMVENVDPGTGTCVRNTVPCRRQSNQTG